MIRSVTFEKTTYNRLPYKFEAGTPPVAGAIGLGAAIEFANRTGLPRIEAYEKKLLAYATSEILKMPGVRIIGTSREKAAILSFVINGIHPHDAATILDQEGIALRAGHHCAMPAMQRFSVPATIRASFAFYNTMEEARYLAESLQKVVQVFR